MSGADLGGEPTLPVATDGAVIGHVGDRRVYRLRDGALVQLTIDHSLLGELQATGVTPDANFAWRHVV